MSKCECDHGWLWMAIAVLVVWVGLLVVSVAYDEDHFGRRIKALETHCALDAEVKDMDQRVKRLEEQR